MVMWLLPIGLLCRSGGCYISGAPLLRERLVRSTSLECIRIHSVSAVDRESWVDRQHRIEKIG